MNTGNKQSNITKEKVAIICLTEAGSQVALKIFNNINSENANCHSDVEVSDVYIPTRLQSSNHVEKYHSTTITKDEQTSKGIVFYENWRDTFTQVFQQYSQIVCIMATGIVVRSVAPLLESKYLDPAVVVVDEAGQFAISLLSGHVGGANELAVRVANAIGSTPVITTATDVQGKPAVDVLAQQLHASIEPLNQVKVFNRLLVENQQVVLTSPLPVVKEIQQGFVWQSLDQDQPVITISPLEQTLFNQLETTPRIHIIPRNLVIGIGCRKDAPVTAIRSAVETVLERCQFHRQSIKAFATIDIKGNEPGIQQVAKEWDIPLITVSKEEIQMLEGQFAPSDWVQKSIGVGGVCEPAARIVAKQGVTIIPKQIINSVTISVAMEKSWWLDWDRETEIIQRLQP